MENKIEKIIRTFIGFNYSKRTNDLFHRWMISNIHSSEKDAAFHKLWSKTKNKTNKNTEKSFQQVLNKLGIEPTTTIKMYRPSIWKYAAAAVVIIAISVFSTYQIMENDFDQSTITMVEHSVRNGKTEIFTLPDGSTIHLNAGSHILYPKNLEGANRTIYLVGEAKFKVAKNPQRPFIVRSSNMAVTALGTEFNVKAYPEENKMVATLIEGKVKVNCNDTTSYILAPGEQVIYNRYTAESQHKTADVESVTAWQRGEVIFHKATINEISQELERRYGIMFRSPKKKIDQDRYNFAFKEDASIEEVLNVMQIVIGGFNYQLKDNICYIYWK